MNLDTTLVFFNKKTHPQSISKEHTGISARNNILRVCCGWKVIAILRVTLSEAIEASSHADAAHLHVATRCLWRTMHPTL